MKEVEIYFDDLRKEKQKELLQAFGIKSPEDLNWDVFPVAIVPVSDRD